MKKRIKNILLFMIVFIVIGEVFVRLRNSVSDFPERTIDSLGIQKYYPNQKGYFAGGSHTWEINELGWPGGLPEDYNNLITIIGDSFIENFMNPGECHQAVLLKDQMSQYNFLEAGRSGVSFIEAMEIKKQLNVFNPINNFIYVHDNDFVESVNELGSHADITQYSIENERILNGEMKSPGLKKVLYNWKLLFFCYNKYPVDKMIKRAIHKKNTPKSNPNLEFQDSNNELYQRVEGLMEFVRNNYDVEDITLVFRSNADKKIVDIGSNSGFANILLNSNQDSSWTFKSDHHWTCYGHRKAAEQISKVALKRFSYNEQVAQSKEGFD